MIRLHCAPWSAGSLYLCWWGVIIGAQAMNLVYFCLAPIGFGLLSLCMSLLKYLFLFGTAKKTMFLLK